jgi:predicted RNase H-like nuclease (RuvC/YqgF family)
VESGWVVSWVEIVTALVTFLIAPTTAVLTWKLSKRKTNAETDTTIAEGAKATVDAMHSVMSELRLQVKVLAVEAESLRTEADSLRAENAMLKKQVDRLQEQVDLLTKEGS